MQILTDQEFTYRQSPTEEDGLAKITDVKGNTIVWNQLVPTANKDFTSTDTDTRSLLLICRQSASPYTELLNKNNVSVGILTAILQPAFTGSIQIIHSGRQKNFNILTSNIVSVVSGHKYLLSMNVVGADTSVVGGVSTKDLMIFDLTQMGLDITDPSEFTSLFSLPYYAYNQGSLLSFMGNGIKTVGKNLFDFSKFANGTITFVDGVLNGTGAQFYTAYGTYATAKKLNCPKGSQITISFDAWTDQNVTSSGNGLIVVTYHYDGTHEDATVPNATGTPRHYTLQRQDIEKIGMSYGTQGANRWHIENFQVEFGTAETPYEPYTESTLSLPISTYFPSGMKSAGSVYDELTESKAITRIGSVDLGSLNWVYLTSGSILAPYFYASFNGIKSQGNPATKKANIICSKYQNVIRDQTYFVDKTICADGSPTVLTQIQIKDSSYTDATAFKNSLQGEYLYYEMVAETETSFTTASLVTENPQGLVYPPQSKEEYPFFKSYKGGTEQLLPENSSVPVTAPIICDLMYSSGAIQVTTYPNPEQGGETSGDGWYLVGEEATVNALPNEHYAFNNWVLDGEIVSTDPEYTFEVKDE